MQEYQISIITISYNSAKTIEKTIKSVLEQKNVSFEYIIIDGGSTDNTLEIIEPYKNRLKLISEKDNGIYDAMNKGIRLAQGEIISILNSDDIFMYDNVLSELTVFFKNNNSVAVYSNLQYHNKENKIVRKWKAGKMSRNNFCYGWMPPHPGLFIKKVMYNKMGLYDCNYTISGDYELILRFFFKERVKLDYFKKTTVSMLSGGVSNSNFKNKIASLREDLRACRNNGIGIYAPLCKVLRKLSQFL